MSPDDSKADGVPLVPATKPAGEAGDEAGLSFSSAPAGSPGEESATIWYVAKPGGENEGPFSLSTLKTKASAGELRPRDLVWKSGLESWIPLSEVPGMEHTRAKSSATAPSKRTGGSSSFMSRLTGMLSKPSFFRITGLVCGGLTLLALMVSLVLLFWKRSAFSETLILFLLFVVCQATASVLEALERIEGKSTPELRKQ